MTSTTTTITTTTTTITTTITIIIITITITITTTTTTTTTTIIIINKSINKQLNLDDIILNNLEYINLLLINLQIRCMMMFSIINIIYQVLLQMMHKPELNPTQPQVNLNRFQNWKKKQYMNLHGSISNNRSNIRIQCIISMMII